MFDARNLPKPDPDQAARKRAWRKALHDKAKRLRQAEEAEKHRATVEAQEARRLRRLSRMPNVPEDEIA